MNLVFKAAELERFVSDNKKMDSLETTVYDDMEYLKLCFEFDEDIKENKQYIETILAVCKEHFEWLKDFKKVFEGSKICVEEDSASLQPLYGSRRYEYQVIL